MKTEFDLVWANNEKTSGNYTASIIGREPDSKPYVSLKVYSSNNPLFIKDKDLERFAVNILKALKSKKLT